MDHGVVISGCSGGGKSTLIGELARRGFGTVPEPGRRIVRAEQAAGGTALPWTDLGAFARRAVALAIEDRDAARGLKGWVFFDRGLVDAAVAQDAAGGPPALLPLGRAHRYHRLVFLTPPWPELYRPDAERRHGLADAVAEYDRLCVAYALLGYETVILPRIATADRADLILGRLGPPPR